MGELVAITGGTGRQPRWQRVGRAVRTKEAGWYAVDLRGSDIGPDQLDALRLAGPEPDGIETKGFTVSETVQNGSLLTLKVAEFADLTDAYLWLLKQPSTFLVEALRDGIAGLGEAPLAGALAGGAIGGASSPAPDPPGFHPAQGDAYRACLGQGVHLVWGPPGTGKTTVLKRAIGDLVARGDRVLLVSATNIAVDNALLGVVKENRHSPGDIVRVGPPQLREVADNPEVSLPLMVRERLAETAERRRGIEAALVDVRTRAAELAALDASLVRFDPTAYFDALKLLRTPGQDPVSVRERAETAAALLEEAVATREAAQQAAVAAQRRQDAAEESRRKWAEVDRLRKEQSRILKAAERKQADALMAEDYLRELREELGQLDAQRSVARWRAREKRQELREQLAVTEEDVARTRRAAQAARTTAEAHIVALEKDLADLVAGITHTPERIAALEQALASAQSTYRSALDLVAARREETTLLERAVVRALNAAELTARAEQQDWPARHARAERLRPRVTADAARRSTLEEEFQQVQEEYERLARNAQGEIIKSAKLVATTLARFRTNKAVFEGPYDVVLVDEAGAATLPEVILATAKAIRTAVLLGDFMQLGPVVEERLKELDRPDVKRWLLPDVFQHCGIQDPEDARRHPACVTLTEQRRFGPAVMGLANSLAYGGMLRGGKQTAAPRPSDDPEIVVVDTDGLHELARPHLTGRRSGWWPAGSLIARALVEYHRAKGEDTGIVTPYGVQAEATLEALRDVESDGGPLAEVGTAHRFQGREFPVVVFDTVEGADGRELWMSLARREPGASDWARNGVRLFNVAATRVQTRLYVIGSWERIRSAKNGTAFTHLAALVGTPGVRRLRAGHLITPPHEDAPNLGEFGAALADVLARHVEVTGIDDETTFFSTFEDEIRKARASVWLWAPWVANRVRGILPLLREAADRGVRVTVFIRDDTDQIQARPDNQSLIADLRAVVHTVVPVNVMHQKIAVIDERTVMIGSLNTLSQSWTREVMVTIRGGHFARKVLEHEHAELFTRPPKCARCGGTSIELRRRTNGIWFWRCYDTVCKTGRNGRSDAWNQDIRVGGGRS
ncbi:AAA domain-containing protein [Streptomyces echinatus]|uniref:Putative nucleic acid-binding Zn-ribbon protein n=1 Tax=Streptomyces echinatus TaxID=67293 RepID=A0A7W9UTQ9_9ACTN|nr:AAA domain-containing protein [Streptomyces echinatus]MBB5929834.1 putative nucleic acid-binding Zn-ribbon protein [Streptomyces echinatus]